ncbi:VCBS repeat-containing protein [Pseudoalteromonas shioyasakiensis]|uniref:FG-GAP repeat domain-containing protein n=1 Tax=Pseudoalteromonas shioyasakiensis TaxID=1190813 RepID=UPI00211802C4|nr:VCBS repeat-containing protein [Pseudoalteromonas shioyasakiensis]MCQ8877901.1 VCBS repeat-containing protein [Pseudoalteromonas shioyasakiensis]
MLKSLLATSVLLLSPLAIADQQLVIKTTKGLISTDSPIAFAFNDELKQLAKVDLANNQNHMLSLPKNLIGFDAATLANTLEPQALILTTDGVYLSAQTKSTLLFEFKSVLNQLELDKFTKVNFVIDANDDGLSDILLPDIETNTLYIQDQQGQFHPHVFTKQAQFQGDFRSKRFKLDIDISITPQVIDVNQDGHTDLVFTNDKQAHVLLTKGTTFADKVTDISFPVKFGKIENDNYHYIDLLSDINNDGFVDLITKIMPDADGMDAMSATVHRNLYMGLASGGFSSQAATLPQTSMIGNLKFDEDFNNDGLMELQRFNIDFGFGTLASMAMGGGDTDVDVEFSVHKQLADGTFSEEPNADFEVETPLSMSNNSSLKPLFLADINGDGKLDAIYKSGSKTLSVYYSDADDLLSSKRKKIKHKLPDNNGDILLVDINNDNKKDFVFKFTEEDGNSTIKTVIN